MINLGDRVKDKITGMVGIAIGSSQWLYGCNQFCVKPEELKDGKPIDAFWIDEYQLDIVNKNVISGRPPVAEGNSGPNLNPMPKK